MLGKLGWEALASRDVGGRKQHFSYNVICFLPLCESYLYQFLFFHKLTKLQYAFGPKLIVAARLQILDFMFGNLLTAELTYM